MDEREKNSVTELQAWYDTPLGKEMLGEEQRLIDRALAQVQGNHLLQITLDGRRWFCDQARAQHGVLLSPRIELGMEMNSVLAEHESLPFQSAVVDIVLLHHALEFSPEPHQVLREAARVLRPGGHLIMLSFNPNSLFGLHQQLKRENSAPWNSALLRSGRLTDWFRLLQLSPLSTESRGYAYPLENEKWRGRLRPLGVLMRNLPMPSGNLVLMMARKDVGGMTPILPEWNRRLLGGLQVIESKARRSGIRRNQT